jgi:hypothetical protein
MSTIEHLNFPVEILLTSDALLGSAMYCLLQKIQNFSRAFVIYLIFLWFVLCMHAKVSAICDFLFSWVV